MKLFYEIPPLFVRSTILDRYIERQNAARASISFRMIYDPLVSVKSEFGQSSLSNRRFGSDESTESFSNKVQSETSNFQKLKDLGYSLIYIYNSYGHVVRDFESEAKTR